MDFFEHQEAARRATGRLIVLFALAVLGIVVLTYLAVVVVLLAAGGASSSSGSTGGLHVQRLIDPMLLAVVGGSVFVTVALGTLYKMASLRSGGSAVANMLGGRLVNPQSLEPDERKLLNIVEEMALASGTPVPPVYVMDDEPGINAFAAGYAPGDAVIGVTRGCMRLLSRDELQGVIAHEFSHILNGDMRLNIRLIGLLHGILVIALVGMMILRSLGRTRVRTSRNNKGGGAVLVILALGMVLMVIGYAGVFFGRLIKAAVSRQREFLADAAAVQFTRYPAGLAGALKKIGGLVAGSHVGHSRAEEASHLFFGQAMEHWLGGLMATHPPLLERVRRLEPTFNGRFQPVAEDREPEARVTQRVSDLSVSGLAGAPRPTRQPPSQRLAPAVTQVGQPGEAHLRYAAALLAALPDPVRDAARQPLSAQALIFALLLDPREEIAQRQLQSLAQQAEPMLRQEFAHVAPHVQQVDARARLPLIDLALGSLRDLSPAQSQRFIDLLKALINADQKVELFEWTLHRMVLRHVGAPGGSRRPGMEGHVSLISLAGSCALLLSTLAHAGHRQPEQARRVFEHAVGKLQLGRIDMATAAQCTLAAVDHALTLLARVAPLHKRRLLQACAACVSADGEVGVREAELLRAIADGLECPMPPLLPGQPLV